MLKKIAQISSLSLMVAFAAALPAIASEEDIAAPVGSFTSDMAIPAPLFAAHQHHGWFHAHMQGHEKHRA